VSASHGQIRTCLCRLILATGETAIFWSKSQPSIVCTIKADLQMGLSPYLESDKTKGNAVDYLNDG
jgi:hypothetical protein